MSEPGAEPSAAGGFGGGLIATAIARPVGVLVGVILVILFGALALGGIPIQLTPDVEVPSLSVDTRWPGAAPSEVEREIIEEQEKVLKSLQGLVRMTSTSSVERAEITLELEVGTDIDEALVRVTNRLAQVPSYPQTADQPVVSTGRSTGPPLAVVLLQAADKGAVGQYRTWFEREILPQLERIKGVSKVDFFGGRDTEIHVQFDANALAARKVSLDALAAVVRAELRDVSAGDLDLGKREYTVRTPATPDEIEGLEDLVLGFGADGQAVRVGDVAKVHLGLREQSAYVMGDDHESMALLFRREAGSNVLEVTREIHRVVDEVQTEWLDRLGLELRVAADQVSYIEGALSLIRNNLLVGGVLAAGVLLLFLRSISASAVVSVAIPVCVVGTALGMSLLGRSVNVVSLAGMAFAVGMVVDNAIVVLESIDAWRDRVSPARAALEGTREVWGAILASTLTTAAVFLPIITWQDEVGELLRDVAVAISVAVCLSLVVSVLVIPSFAAKLLRRRDRTGRPSLLVRAGNGLREGVARTVHWLTRSIWRALPVAVVVPATMALVAWLFVPPMEYLPTGNRNLLFGILVPPPGYSMQEMKGVGQRFQAEVSQHLGKDVDGVPAVERSFFVVRPSQAFMGASTVDPDRIGELAAWYRKQQAEIPGAFGFASQASLFGRGIGSGRAVEVEISGADLEALVGIGGRMFGMLKGVLPDAQIRPIPSLDLGSPELQVHPRRRDATALGMNGAGIGAVVDALVDGRIVGEMGRDGEQRMDVVLQPREGAVTSRTGLEAASVATPSGRVVPLRSLADVVETVGPATIQHIERRRAITLQVSPPDDVALEEAMDRIRDEVVAPLEAEGLPEGVRIDLAGTADKLVVTKARMGWTLLLALVISFLLMAALFEDFLAPIVVLVTVPLAAAGGIVGLRLVDFFLGPQPLDMMTALGFVILIGVVVNNAILVVDGALARLREGSWTLADAVSDAVRRRVRPIFMSTLTSLAGLLPLVLIPGSGSELYRGVGAVVLGGMALATVLTLFVIPPVFVVVWKLARRGS